MSRVSASREVQVLRSLRVSEVPLLQLVRPGRPAEPAPLPGLRSLDLAALDVRGGVADVAVDGQAAVDDELLPGHES
jgi:hypothetical protein